MAIETAVIAVAAILSVSAISTVMLSIGARTNDEAADTVNDGISGVAGGLITRPGVISIRGDVDVDGDDTINLAGSDSQAVTKVVMVVTAGGADGVDLTPPYLADATGTDPDVSGLSPTTFVKVVTANFNESEAAWTVTFPGTGDGDYFLEPGERAEITVWLHRNDLVNSLYEMGAGESDPFIDESGELVLANALISIEVIPLNSGAMVVERVLPPELSASDLLD